MNKPKLRILFLDDVEDDAIIIRELLREEGLLFQFDYVSTEKEFTEMLESRKYDIVFSDYNLPGFNGIGALLISKEICPDVPFICISGKIGEDLAVELMRLGASDYILKDRLSRLPVVIERVLQEVEVRNAKKAAQEEIKNMKESLEKLNLHLDEIRENERASISREIHDQLGQSLTALKIDTEWLHEKNAGGTEESTRLEGMIKLITNMSQDVQRIASELRPPILDDLGLASAMEWYIIEFEKRTKIYCLRNLAEVQFSDQAKNLVLYRILQEALTNVARHAGAKNIIINLNRSENSIHLEIIDDGIGLEKKIIFSHKSLGFIGIRERLKQHNGKLDIQSTLYKGTKLSISIPFN